MSKTFSIGCRDCKKHLWIAQASAGTGHIYTAKEYPKHIYDFLMAHKGHNLVFDDNCESDIADWEEIEMMEECDEQ